MSSATSSPNTKNSGPSSSSDTIPGNNKTIPSSTGPPAPTATSGKNLDTRILNLSRHRMEMAQIVGRQTALAASTGAYGKNTPSPSNAPSSSTPSSIVASNELRRALAAVQRHSNVDPALVNKKLAMIGGIKSWGGSNSNADRDFLLDGIINHTTDYNSMEHINNNRPKPAAPSDMTSSTRQSVGGAKLMSNPDGLRHDRDQPTSAHATASAAAEAFDTMLPSVGGNEHLSTLLATQDDLGSRPTPQRRLGATVTNPADTVHEGNSSELLQLHRMERDQVDRMMNSLLAIRQNQEQEIRRLSALRDQEEQQKKRKKQQQVLEEQKCQGSKNNNKVAKKENPPAAPDSWHICKHCKAKAFASMEDAEEHEAECPSKKENTAGDTEDEENKDKNSSKSNIECGADECLADSCIPRVPFDNQQQPSKTRISLPSWLSGPKSLTSKMCDSESVPYMGKSLPAPHQMKHLTMPPPHPGSSTSSSSTSPHNASLIRSVDPSYSSSSPQSICIPLATPQDQALGMSPFHCFVRRHCIQVFTTQTEQHLSIVGIRCPFCTLDSSSRNHIFDRHDKNVLYPANLSDIYNCANQLLRNHVSHCTSVPMAVAKCFRELLSKPSALHGSTKDDWMEAAQTLGLVNAPSSNGESGGVRFVFVDDDEASVVRSRPPPSSTLLSSSVGKLSSNPSSKSAAAAVAAALAAGGPTASALLSKLTNTKPKAGAPRSNQFDKIHYFDQMNKNLRVKEHQHHQQSHIDELSKLGNDNNERGPSKQSIINQLLSVNNQCHTADSNGSSFLVIPSDAPTTTSFSYCLLAQMRCCSFTEADRLGKRKGLPVGFAGLACRHCYGRYGAGRFFPSTLKTLSDTSKTLDVLHKHMAKCRKCPPEVREGLDKLREKHDEERARMKFGSQKAFFAKIWERLHGRSDDRAMCYGDKAGNAVGGAVPGTESASVLPTASATVNNIKCEAPKAQVASSPPEDPPSTTDGIAALSVAAALHMAVLQNSNKRKVPSAPSSGGGECPQNQQDQNSIEGSVMKRPRAA